MVTGKDGKPIEAMAFYHQNGLRAAWNHAMRFAGESGRIATLPEVINARLLAEPGEFVWERYFTTLSAEYFGFGKDGKRILIVAHGVGPMATLDGIIKAYSWEFNDKTREHRGGRITQQEFWDLQEGKYGPVEIVDIEAYCSQRTYPFVAHLRFSQAISDPVLKARLGKDPELYITACRDHAQTWHREQAGITPENRFNLTNHDQYLIQREKLHRRMGEPDSSPFIIKIEGGSFPYFIGAHYREWPEIEEGYATAYLLSISGYSHTHHDGGESLMHDISCHDWGNGTRFVGIKPEGSTVSGILPGPDPDKILKRHWRKLFRPAGQQQPVDFVGLTKIGRQWFTQYPIKGKSMQSYEPEFKVLEKRKVGRPVLYRTEISGHHMFFRIDLTELKAIAPPLANAFCFEGDPEDIWEGGNPTYHECFVQFYHVEADTSRRLIRTSELAHDYLTMIALHQES